MAADFLTLFAAALHRPLSSLDRTTALTDLGVDSFDLVDVLVALQEELGVRMFQEDLQGVVTVGDLEAAFQRRQEG